MMIVKWWVELIILLVGLAAAYEDEWEEHKVSRYKIH